VVSDYKKGDLVKAPITLFEQNPGNIWLLDAMLFEAPKTSNASKDKAKPKKRGGEKTICPDAQAAKNGRAQPINHI
jgi:hypothetical protein